MDTVTYAVVGARHPSESGSFSGKSRKPNWTDIEIRTLIQGYADSREVMRRKTMYGLDGQKKSSYSNEEKHRVWKRITDAVNRTKGPSLSGTSVCERTVKEVIKKWVNLVNKMKCDVATQRRHPGTEMCLTSKAVHTIMNTNEPLNLNQTWPTSESGGDIDMYPGYQSTNEPLVKVEKSEESEEYPTKYRKILPNTLRNVILKRVSDVDLPAESSPVESSPAMTSPPNKRARSEQADSEYNGTEENFHNGMDEYEDHVTEDSTEAPSFQPFYNAEYETDNFMKLNREVLELKKKKLLTKIEKLEFERESAENDRDRSRVEKETAVLLQEKVKLELEMLKKKAENTSKNAENSSMKDENS